MMDEREADTAMEMAALAEPVIVELLKSAGAGMVLPSDADIIIGSAIMAERERCANIAEEHQVATAGKPSDYTNGFNSAALIIATAIRTPSP